MLDVRIDMAQDKIAQWLRSFETSGGRVFLAVLLSLPSALVMSFCLKSFWLAQYPVKLIIMVGLVVSFGLLYWVLLSTIHPITEERKIKHLSLFFVLVAVLTPTGMLFDAIKSHFLILQPHQVTLRLSSPTSDNARLRIISASLLGSKRTFNPAKFARECELQAETLSVAPGSSCEVTYLVTSYEADRLMIVFDLSQSVGKVEVATPVGGNQYLFETPSESDKTETFSVALTWVQKRIKYPVFAMLGFSLFMFLTLLSLAGRSLLHRDKSVKKPIQSVNQLWVYLLLVLIALMYANTRFGSGFKLMIDLSSDAGNIASYVAAYDHPTSFRADALLANPQNFSEYFTVFLPFISTLARLTGSYASAFMVLLAPVAILHLFGYYLLGKRLFSSRNLALCLAIVTAIPIGLPLFEYYGLSGDILPRSLFQALLPFGLLALLTFAKRPKWYWLVSLIFTLLLYIHPVSGPAWVGICLISLLLFAIRESGKRWWVAFLPAVLIFFVGVIPFLQAYFRADSFAVLDPKLLEAVNLSRYTSQTLPILEFYRGEMWVLLRGHWSLITLSLIDLSFVIWTVVRLLNRSKLRSAPDPQEKISGLLSLWWVVLVLVAVVVPLIDEMVANAFGRPLLLREIRRTMRYFVPMLWLTFFWVCQKALVLFGRAKQPANHRPLVWLAILSLLICYGIEIQIWKNPIFVRQWECLRSGNLICKPDEDTLAMYDFYTELPKHVEPDESVFPDPDPQYLADSLIPRYHSLHSVAYTYKDGGAVGDFLPEWWRITQALRPYLPTSEHGLDPNVVEVASTTGADYFYFIHPDQSAMNYLETQQVIFQNDYGTLISLK